MLVPLRQAPGNPNRSGTKAVTPIDGAARSGLARPKWCSNSVVRGHSTRALATAGDEPLVDPAWGQPAGQDLAEAGSALPQHARRQRGQGFLTALHRPPRSTTLGPTGDAEGFGGLEAFGWGIAAAPGHPEQHQDQGLGAPTRGSPLGLTRVVGWLPHSRCEKLP